PARPPARPGRRGRGGRSASPASRRPPQSKADGGVAARFPAAGPADRPAQRDPAGPPRLGLLPHLPALLVTTGSLFSCLSLVPTGRHAASAFRAENDPLYDPDPGGPQGAAVPRFSSPQGHRRVPLAVTTGGDNGDCLPTSRRRTAGLAVRATSPRSSTLP